MAVDYYVYSDESGLHGRDARYCIVCGYFGSPRQWKLFNKDWAAVLSKYNVPEFHAIEFFPEGRRKRSRHYDGWSTDTCAKFLRALLATIGSRKLTSVGGAINLEAFRSLPEVDRRLLTGADIRILSEDERTRNKWMTSGAPNKPYYVGAVLLLMHALQHAPSNTFVHFIFDRQDEYEGWMREAFHDIVSGDLWAELPLPGRLGELTYAESDKTVALQAADLHAYVWNRYLSRRGLSGEVLTAAEQHINSKSGAMLLAEIDHLRGVVEGRRQFYGEWLKSRTAQ